ncbi:PREDICTED: F-box/WD repeat-containing protein 4 [Dufourea novaeangliae]|uniref:F-box/WD repeat-containing protein 4 n=1 Tax=Dufourea novaeangliae TaxID=178035 RepID=A0A154PLR3_DUFNO|nr:PREDICTED: F-box/WD repeat-containing protein 4 [Dufourea novaeangliae]KZC12394.1 F-box/WD repeat-containing protein 4 [Dufourea novaeangliae]
MTDARRLDTLPSDVLILIFDYCHAFDLVRLSEVCTRFYDIIRGETLWIKKSKQPIATNQTSRKFRERCNPLLCLRTKWHVSHNWQYGRYEKRVLSSQKIKLMPWIQLTSDILWWSGGNQLCGFKRTWHSHEAQQNNRILVNDNIRSDICKFIVRNECIITGHRDGSIQFWTKSRCDESIDFYCSIDRAHTSDVNAVDETCDAIMSGSGDGTVKIWGPVGQRFLNIPVATLNIADRVWSLSADPTGKKVAVGSAGNSDSPPLHIFDLECYSESHILNHNWQRGAGILDMVWDSPQILLTCGYDTYIRKWDLRTGTCVYSWADPTDATIYCISSDYYYTMLTGTQFNCKTVLWDQRQRNYVQLYFMNLSRMSSPVYCLDFDSAHLYGATDQHLVELTFSGYSYKETNYKEILRYERIRTN